MTKNLKWRLSKLPTPDEVRELVKDKIITQDEARDILFSQETEENRDNESLKSEIKFLRELAEKLSNGNSAKVVEIIREVQKPYYYQAPWYKPYQIWCSSANSNTYGTTLTANTALNFASGTPFSQISTF